MSKSERLRTASATWPLGVRHYRGTEWEVVDRDGIVWALTWSEQDARTFADAVNSFNGTKNAATPELMATLRDAPILSKYHGMHGFEIGLFIDDYTAWSERTRAAIAKTTGSPS